MLTLFCLALSLLAPIRHITVPEDTLVVVIEFIQLKRHADFVQCMRGPSARCYNTAWTLNPDMRVWVCTGLPPVCMQFDENTDGGVDLHDFAIRTRRLSGGVRRAGAIELKRVVRP